MSQQDSNTSLSFRPEESAYMSRALSLAEYGRGYASPNPMVGAVIVGPDGRIIGEGWHRRFGSWHAEVNAVNSVALADRHLLRQSTMYVTLEPCAHYGKTPPCANLIVEQGIPRVVVATVDPFAKVAGRGIQIMRDAGVKVEVGLLGERARELNRKFFFAHTHRRPYVTLKWARSADGYMDARRSADNNKPFRFSVPLTTLQTMQLRADNDCILTTSSTVLADDCSLTVRGIAGRQPQAVILDRSGRLNSDSYAAFHRKDQEDRPLPEPIVFGAEKADLASVLASLYADYGFISVLVEAGPTMLNEFIDSNLWNEARVETAPVVLGSAGAHPAPSLKGIAPADEYAVNANRIQWFRNPEC